MASNSLAPGSSPGEVSAPAVWVALSALLVAFGVDAAQAAAIGGMAGVLAPYVVKLVVWFRRSKP